MGPTTVCTRFLMNFRFPSPQATDIFDASGMQPPGQTQYTHERRKCSPLRNPFHSG